MLTFRPATLEDLFPLLALVNGAYRARQSWTHECDLLAGQRITAEGLRELLTRQDSRLESAWSDGQLVGCVHLQFGEACQLGMLSVNPTQQKHGLGRGLLERAHRLAEAAGYSEVTLTVLRQRPELLAYYQRRGYVLTGRTHPFPVHEQVGQPLCEDLELLELAFRLP